MPIIFSGIIILDVGDLFWVAGSNLDEAEDLKKFQDTQNFALREILRDILDKDHARRAASGAI